jgi:hypothetical protein
MLQQRRDLSRRQLRIFAACRHRSHSHLSEAHLIVCDEVSMMHKETLRIMHLALQDLTGNRQHSFGGTVFVLGGDFKQLLPIVPPTARATPIEHSLLSSPYWEQFQAMRLSINQR